ncbi:MAG TPA: YraN family protein [Candidatus Eremiobacteraceae bacterium]|nr:YraN family protein [Candidatus Eremiobacteraceae bacterium]
MSARSPRDRKQAHGLGLLAERFAIVLLRLKGYRILACRYQVRNGEIDIVARRGYSASERPVFRHAGESRLSAPGRRDLALLASYHPSRQNTNTGKLTQEMLDRVFLRAKQLLADA